MQDALTIYFNGEKYAGLLLAGIGVAIIAAAAVMFRAGGGLRPFAITLAVVAVAEIVLGVGLYARTGPQVERLQEQLGSEAATFYAAEASRMARVQRNFVVIEYVELFIIVAGGIAAVSLKPRPAIAGVTLALVISASLLLAFDFFAERRGAEYLLALDRGRIQP